MWKELSEPFRYPRQVNNVGATSVPSNKKDKRKAKDMAGTLKRLWMYLSLQKGRLILVLVMVFLSSGLALLGPYMIGTAIDTYLERQADIAWLYFLGGLGLVYGLH